MFTFPEDMSPKMNVLEILEFELACYDVAVKLVSHYAIGTFLLREYREKKCYE